MFNNAFIYKISGLPEVGAIAFDVALQPRVFVPCGKTQDKSVGWVPPRGEANGLLMESVAGQLICRLAIETKSVPRSEIDKLVAAKSDAIEGATGRKPGKKERRELQEDALLALLPNAFAKRKDVPVWIDPKAQTMVIAAGSQSAADEVVGTFLHCIAVSVGLVQTVRSPQSAMTQWLLSDHIDMPGAFAIERECVLKSNGEDSATVKFAKHNLDNPEVRKHITEGKLPTHLAISWDGKVSVTLTEHLQLKKIALLDGVMDASGTDKHEDRFDADVALSTGLLAPMIAELIEALGGEVEVAQVKKGDAA
jgi:recombination associated protein RdgC